MRALLLQHKVRNQVYKYYDNACAVCGLADKDCLQIDHVIPRCKGGKDEFDNYQILCIKCNSIKSSTQTDKIAPIEKKYHWGKPTKKVLKKRLNFKIVCRTLKQFTSIPAT